jgi:hypothetical protein
VKVTSKRLRARLFSTLLLKIYSKYLKYGLCAVALRFAPLTEGKTMEPLYGIAYDEQSVRQRHAKLLEIIKNPPIGSPNDWDNMDYKQIGDKTITQEDEARQFLVNIVDDMF